MAAHEDEAVEVVEGAKVDGAAFACHIVASGDRRSALRRQAARALVGTASYAPDNLIT